MKHFAKFTWFLLAYNMMVILWGAYVRATGSGAGCGNHWPTCNGEVIPRTTQVETAIEFTHRLSSGLALLLVVALFVWALRIYPKGHPVRLGAGLSLLFIITEALVGAGLVLFGWVAKDASTGRAVTIVIHLVNTFLLLASLVLTGWWALGGRALRLRGQGVALWGMALALLGVVLLGMSGAITALGDTLFPAQSLVEGIQQDVSETAHFLLRLRVWHPVIAIVVGLYVLFLAGMIAMFRTDRLTRWAALVIGGLFCLQLGAGLVNLILLAPVWMQIIHLLLADLVWVTLVLLSAAVFQSDKVESPML